VLGAPRLRRSDALWELSHAVVTGWGSDPQTQRGKSPREPNVRRSCTVSLTIAVLSEDVP
jgi:hypothetical protein